MRKYSDLEFSDDFMFYSVLTLNPDLLKELLERILDMEIADIQFSEGQKTMEYCYTGRGIRLDVYAKSKNGKVFNVEMQTSREKEIPKRMRYYQGMMDVNLLERAEDYTEIEDSYIIFICLNDTFQKNLPVYTFKNICTEDNSIRMEDGTSKIVVNVSGDKSKASKKLIPLLEYIESHKVTDDFTGRIQNEVTRIKGIEERRNEYMLYELNLKRAKADGRTEGEFIGRIEGIVVSHIKMAKRYDWSESQLVEEIATECKCSKEKAQELIKKYTES